MMDVFVANEQSQVELAERRYVALGRVCAEEEGVDPAADVCIIFIDRESMASLKERFTGEEGATDVLSFPMDEQAPEEGPYMLGDVFVCAEVARDQAAEQGTTLTQELDLLVVHGFLHLLGYNHTRPQDARTMRHRERKILQAFYRTEGGGRPPKPRTQAAEDADADADPESDEEPST